MIHDTIFWQNDTHPIRDIDYLGTEHIFSLCGEINVLRVLFVQVLKGIVNAEAKSPSSWEFALQQMHLQCYVFNIS